MNIISQFSLHDGLSLDRTLLRWSSFQSWNKLDSPLLVLNSCAGKCLEFLPLFLQNHLVFYSLVENALQLETEGVEAWPGHQKKGGGRRSVVSHCYAFCKKSVPSLLEKRALLLTSTARPNLPPSIDSRIPLFFCRPCSDRAFISGSLLGSLTLNPGVFV